MTSKSDVFIIGGGPAGLTLAIRLLQLGYQVSLAESTAFPRAQVGESLSPGVLNVLEFLGSTRPLDLSLLQHDVPSFLFWDSQFNDSAAVSTISSHFIVDRGIFDAELMIFALSLGLVLFQPVKVSKYEKQKELWKIAIGDDQHFTSVLVDARGRSGTQQNRLDTALPLAGLYADFPLNANSNFSVVEAVGDGWLYGAPTCRNDYRVMAFTDLGLLKTQKKTSLFSELIQNTFLQEHIIQNEVYSQIKSCLALTYVNKNPWIDGLLCLGDAAFTLDPLSSTGVEKAMRFSLQTAIAINTLFKTGDQVLPQDYFEDKIIDTISQHSRWSQGFYASAWANGINDFWNTRAATYTGLHERSDNLFIDKLNLKMATHTVVPLVASQKKIISNYSSYWSSPFFISKNLTAMESICINDDLLIRKISYQHPNLKAEIAFLGGQNVSHLMSIARNAQSFLDLLVKWTEAVGYESAKKIIDFLWEKEILLKEAD